jgi:hypothetical protein
MPALKYSQCDELSECERALVRVGSEMAPEELG